MRFLVRLANENDLEFLVKLVTRLKDLNSELDPHYTTVEDLEDVVRDYINNSLANPDTIILVADDENTKSIVGIVRAQSVDRLFYKPRRALLITDIYVDPRYRRKGLGRLLLRKLEEIAKEKGIEMLIVSYPAGNVIADDFFAKREFKPLQVEKYKHLR